MVEGSARARRKTARSNRKRRAARARPRSWVERRLLDPLSAAAAYGIYALVAALPVTWASAALGRTARLLGPLLPVTRRARRNLAHAFPEKSRAEISAIIRGMWENLGRTAGEYPGMRQLFDDSLAQQVMAVGVEAVRNLPAERRPFVVRGRYVEVVGVENFLDIRDGGRPTLLFSAHYGNWELLPLAGGQFGLSVAVLFRTPNNPHVARLLDHVRRGMGELVPKGVEGALASVRVLEQGGHLGMLVDQKLNRGPAIPFFGRPAMTSPTLAKLAYRFRCPVYGARVERVRGTRFRIVIEPPMPLPEAADEQAFVTQLMTSVNATIERWVRERPELWFWLHRRWPD